MAKLWVRLDDRGVVELGGADARSFLQNLVSIDLDRLTPERSLHGALLTPQGKYLFDFLIVQDAERLLLEVESARAGELVQRLSLYRLRAQVTITDASDDWAVLAAFGDAAADEAGRARRDGDAWVIQDPRLAELGQRVLLRRLDVDAFLAAEHVTLATPERYDLHRLRLGVPDGSRDLLPQRSTLMESNFDELGGISFDKGCFIGQELTARMKHRALTRKRLVPVTVDGPLPASETPVTQNGREVGEMRSGRDGLALALLRIDSLDVAGAMLADGAVLHPTLPEWLARSLGRPA